MGLRQMIIGALGVGEVLAVLAVSGTLEPARTVYEDYAKDTLEGKHKLTHVIDEGALVAPSFGWSLVLATVVSFALAVSLIGVLTIAFARSDDPAGEAASPAPPDDPKQDAAAGVTPRPHRNDGRGSWPTSPVRPER